jgi:hypothetical protein
LVDKTLTGPAEYLAAALDTAEATALDASTQQGPDWTFHPDNIDRALITGSGYAGYTFGDVVSYDEGAPSEHQAEHIAANDPSHVLRVIAAHRKLAELHSPMDAVAAKARVLPPGISLCNVCVADTEPCYDGPPPLSWPCDTVKVLAEAYGWAETP